MNNSNYACDCVHIKHMFYVAHSDIRSLITSLLKPLYQVPFSNLTLTSTFVCKCGLIGGCNRHVDFSPFF